MDLLEPSGGPDNIKRVAAGDSDFCLTSVQHYLTARNEAGSLAARFVAIVVQRSPLAAMVAADSALAEPVDLKGVRVAVRPESPLGAEFLASLPHLGGGRPVVVPLESSDANAALGRGEVEAVIEFTDTLPRARRQAGIALRAIPVGLEIYSSGLVAGDHVADETVWRMRSGVVAALLRQRAAPNAGVVELRRRYPGSDVEEALEGWRLVEPNIFTGPPPGSMDSSCWERTVAFLCDARGLRHVPPQTVYRPQFADVLQPR